MSERFPVTLPDSYEWGSQVVQYADAPPPDGPGFTYYAGDMSDSYPGTPPVDCLLWWEPNASGSRLIIVGILNHYPVDFPPYERAGNVNVWVRPSHKRRGIGTTLVTLAEAMFGPINYEQQQYTAEGAALAEHLGASSPFRG